MENKLLTELFPAVSKDKLKMLISSLSVEIQKSMEKKYGIELDKCEKNITEQDSYMIKKAIYKIKTYLEKEKKYRNADLRKIKEAFSSLSDENKEIIIKTYGKKLDKYQELQIIVFGKLEKAMKEVEKNSTDKVLKSTKKYPIMEEYYHKYPSKYVDKAISLLSKSDREMVRQIENGELDINKNVPFSLTSTITGILGSMIIDCLNYYRDVRRELKVDYDGLTQDAIDKVVNEKLSKKDKAIIDKIRNEEELTKAELLRYKSTIKIISNIIKNDKYVETIFELHKNYPKDDVLIAISKLPEKYQKEITLRYGSDLDNPKRSSEYTKDNGTTFVKEVLPSLKIQLDMLKNPPTKKISVKINPIYLKKENITTETKDDVFKEKMFQKYSVLFNESLTSEEILYLIDVSIKDYSNDLDRERYIIKQLYNHLKGLINDNRDVLEQIYIGRQSKK